MRSCGKDNRGKRTARSSDWPHSYRKRETRFSFANPRTYRLCYRNTITLLLLHTPTVLNWVENHKCKTHHVKGIPCFLCGFCSLFCSYWSGKPDNLRQSYLTQIWENTLRAGWTVGGKQVTDKDDQDACEFLYRFFDVLEEQSKVLKYAMLDAVDIKIDRHLVCASPDCTNSTLLKQDKQRILSCALRDGTDTDVQALIGNYLEDETVDQKCSACQSETLIRSSMNNAPEILLVQVPRVNLQSKKLYNAVSFDEELALSLSGESPYAGGTRYELYAAVFHWGAKVEVGHYTIAAKGPTGRWTMVNDNDRLTPLVFGELQTAGRRRNVTLLAYRKKATGTNEKGQADPPSSPVVEDLDGDQPMVLDAHIELDGRQWAFTEQLASPLSSGAELLSNSAESQAAKVRLTLTEVTGEVLEGVVNVQLRPVRAMSQSPPRGKKGTGKQSKKTESVLATRSSRVRKIFGLRKTVRRRKKWTTQYQ